MKANEKYLKIWYCIENFEQREIKREPCLGLYFNDPK